MTNHDFGGRAVLVTSASAGARVIVSARGIDKLQAVADSLGSTAAGCTSLIADGAAVHGRIMTTAGYLMPALPRALRPMLATRGRRAKARYRR